MQLIKFESDSNLPAYLTAADASMLDINKEVVKAAAFPSLSIKGMKFTINKDGVKRVLTKPEDPDEVAQSIGVVFLRANMSARTFYAKKYAEGESDGARPTCYSHDGVAPGPGAMEPQAKKCAVCPRSQWGSRVDDNGEAKGKECQDNARIAVSAPDKLDPMLLRVPPASLKGLREALKVVAARKIPYNAVVIKIGFDRDAPSPKLTFKPVGLVDDNGYKQVRELYDSEAVRAIVGLDDFGTAEHEEAPKAPKLAVDTDELDAAIAAKEVVKKAAEPKAAPKATVDDLDDAVAEKPAPKPKAAAKPKPQAADSGGADSLLGDLEDLLSNKDD